MFEKMNWLMKLVLISAFGCFVFFGFAPVLQSFFDPQEFISFLNPLEADMPVGQYMIESWSWVNEDGTLIGFLRPLISATFMIEYPLFGINPLGYKLVNLGMHLLCALALGRLVMVLSGKKWLAIFSVALFTLHPGTVVATGMIVSRHDILVCLFSILALNSTYSLSRYSDFTWKAIVPAIFMLLAVNSKELGMMNLIALPIMYFLWPDRLKCRRNTLVFLGSLVFVQVLYVVARKMVFGNIGGYGSYTELAAVPMHIYTVIIQATGAFFVGYTVVRVVIYLLIIGLIVNFTRGKLQNWRKVGVAFLVTGAYSSQSVIGDVATHYVYVAAAFTVLFIVYFAGNITIPGRRGKQILAGIAIMILLFAGVLTRRESLAFNHIYVDCERVFTSLEEISGSLPVEEGSTCFVQVVRNTNIEAEMKNVPLYMRSINTESQCEFIPVRNEIDGVEVPILVWEDERIVIR